MRRLPISWAGSRADSEMQFREIPWSAIKRKLSKPAVGSETFSEYLSWDREKQTEAKDVGYYIIGEFENNRRRNDSFKRRATITLDIDYPGENFRERLTEVFSGFSFFWHTSRKSSRISPRIRVHFPLAADIADADQYRALSRAFADRYGIELVDSVSFVPAQMMFWPSVSSDGVFEFGEHVGVWPDPAAILAAEYEDWRDKTSWPRKELEVPPEHHKERADNPLTKPGIIGAFNRAFPISECLTDLIPGVYEPTDSPGRWRYHAAEGAGGAIIYDRDTAIYSHHTNHDPGAGRSLNAFDLVRVHKFGELDRDTPDDTPPTRWPSFVAMREYAVTHEAVRDELSRADLFEDYGSAPAAADFELPGEHAADAVQPLKVNGHAALDDVLPAVSTRAAQTRSRLRALIADCVDADALEDDVLPQVIAAGLSPIAEQQLLNDLAERHAEITGRRIGATQLKQTAETLRQQLRATPASEGDDLGVEMPPGVALDDKGLPRNTADNIILYLQAGLAGWKIRYDSFLQSEVLAQPQGGHTLLRDTDYTRLRRALERVGFASFGGSNDLIRQAVALIAEENKFDSAMEWCGSLFWDGEPRIETFLSAYYGAEDGEYTRAVSRYLWTALAGRALQPGIKADMVPILVGKQARRKSTSVEALVPAPDYAVTISLKHMDADLSRKLQGRMVAEISELKGLISGDEDAIKTFLQERRDTWIPKFRERSKDALRRCIFVGTTDKDEFLSDMAGNRRYLPVRVGKIDIAGIAAVREQVWAEAVERFYMSGIDWSAETWSAEAHQQFLISDAWDEQVQAWLHAPVETDFEQGDTKNGDQEFSVSAVLAQALKVPTREMDRSKQMRVAKILTRMGYESVTLWSGGRARKLWRRLD